MTQEHSNSAFVHRSPGWHLQMIIQWMSNATDSGKYYEWAKVARQRILPVSINEGYQNFPIRIYSGSLVVGIISEIGSC
jgi:hypothetical protein